MKKYIAALLLLFLTVVIPAQKYYDYISAIVLIRFVPGIGSLQIPLSMPFF